MDIKEKIEEIVEKVKGDESFLAKFKSDPVGAIEGLIGVDLPDDQIKAIVEGVKAKLKLDADGDGKIDIIEKVGDTVSGIGEKIGGIFKKD